MAAQVRNDVQEVLERFFGAQGAREAGVSSCTSGMSDAVVWRINHKGSWALKRWPASGPDPTALAGIHAVLRHAREQGINFVPALHTAPDGQTLLQFGGACWELATWMPGAADESEQPNERILIAVEALAEFHRATRSFPLPARQAASGQAPSVVHRLRLLEQAATTDWHSMATRATATPKGKNMATLLRQLARPLPQAIARAREAVTKILNEQSHLQPVIRDARREHFLFTDNRVTGLIDFGAMQIDAPAVDLARLIGEWDGDDRSLWRRAMDTYGLDPVGRRLVGPLDASGVTLSACNWLTWVAAGRPASRERLEHLLVRLGGLSVGPSRADLA